MSGKSKKKGDGHMNKKKNGHEPTMAPGIMTKKN